MTTLVANARAALACPTCHAAIVLGDGQASCQGCAAIYPLHDGRPVLMANATVDASKRNIVMDHHADLRTGARRSGLRGLADRLRERSNVTVFTDDRVQVDRLVEHARAHLPPGALVVDVGGGEQPYRASLESLGPVLTIDIAAYGATDVIGDAHALPLRDDSVDVLTTVSVLEHLARPWTFFAEAARALREGGILMGVAPQYCPTHGFPNDYYRYTRSGLRQLAESAGLELVDAWPIGGPWATLHHWYWANHARESKLRRVPVVGVAYHAYFQGLSALFDRLDAVSDHGAITKPQEHNDHVGWSFLARKPVASANPMGASPTGAQAQTQTHARGATAEAR
jgi:SAM-dependent methyltransferase